MIGKCFICGKNKIVFTIDAEQGRENACSNCITSNHLTGWSK